MPLGTCRRHASALPTAVMAHGSRPWGQVQGLVAVGAQVGVARGRPRPRTASRGPQEPSQPPLSPVEGAAGAAAGSWGQAGSEPVITGFRSRPVLPASTGRLHMRNAIESLRRSDRGMTTAEYAV